MRNFMEERKKQRDAEEIAKTLEETIKRMLPVLLAHYKRIHYEEIAGIEDEGEAE